MLEFFLQYLRVTAVSAIALHCNIIFSVRETLGETLLTALVQSIIYSLVRSYKNKLWENTIKIPCVHSTIDNM